MPTLVQSVPFTGNTVAIAATPGNSIIIRLGAGSTVAAPVDTGGNTYVNLSAYSLSIYFSAEIAASPGTITFTSGYYTVYTVAGVVEEWSGINAYQTSGQFYSNANAPYFVWPVPAEIAYPSGRPETFTASAGNYVVAQSGTLLYTCYTSWLTSTNPAFTPGATQLVTATSYASLEIVTTNGEYTIGLGAGTHSTGGNVVSNYYDTAGQPTYATAITVGFYSAPPVTPPTPTLAATGAPQVSITGIWLSASWFYGPLYPSGIVTSTVDVQRSPNGSTGWVTLATLPSSSSSTYVDNTVANSTTYWYRLIYHNNAGSTTGASASVAVPASLMTPISISQPAEPTIANQLSWPVLAGTSPTYTPKRSTDGVTYTALIGSPQTATTYLDTAAVPGTLYFYKIHGSSGSFGSADSAPQACLTLGPAAPVAPSLEIDPLVPFAINVQWPPVNGAQANPLTGLGPYTILRSDDGGSTYHVAASGLFGTFWQDTTVAAAGTYHYKVTASDQYFSALGPDASIVIHCLPSPFTVEAFYGPTAENRGTNFANDGFETGVNSFATNGAYTFNRSAEQQLFGNYSLKVTATTTFADQVYKTFTVTNGTTMHISAWIYRTETSADIQMYFQDTGMFASYGNGLAHVNAAKTLGWQQISLSQAVTHTGSGVLGILTNQQVATFYVDGINQTTSPLSVQFAYNGAQIAYTLGSGAASVDLQVSIDAAKTWSTFLSGDTSGLAWYDQHVVPGIGLVPLVPYVRYWFRTVSNDGFGHSQPGPIQSCLILPWLDPVTNIPTPPARGLKWILDGTDVSASVYLNPASIDGQLGLIGQEAKFTYMKFVGITGTVGHRVDVLDGPNVLAELWVSEAEMETLGSNWQNTVIIAQNAHRILAARQIRETYEQLPAGRILANLIARYMPGLSCFNVQPGPIIPYFSAANIDLQQCIIQLLSTVIGPITPALFRIDGNLDCHLEFDGTLPDAPLLLSDANPLTSGYPT